jgi:phosphoglycerol transferase MdoB-like AlkP superfamily enzyme
VNSKGKLTEVQFIENKRMGLAEKNKQVAEIYINILVCFFVITELTRLLEFYHFRSSQGIDFLKLFFLSLKNELYLTGCLSAILLIPYFILSLINKKLSVVFLLFILFIVFLFQLSLEEYFIQSLVPLSVDFWGYSKAEITETMNASGGISFWPLFHLFILMAIAVGLFFILKKHPVHRFFKYFLISITILSPFFIFNNSPKSSNFKSEFEYYLAIDKSPYFIKNSIDYFYDINHSYTFNEAYYIDEKTAVNSDSTVETKSIKYSIPNAYNFVFNPEYPFVRFKDTIDILGKYIPQLSTKPNLVFVIMESMGRAYSGPQAYLGSFTPFLDSLANNSLYWSNFLSNGGRTFAVLPSIFGSLPFAEKGFLELGEKMPAHATLFSILKTNGYVSSFYYGGDAKFDNMSIFLKRNSVNIFDEKSFNSSYKKLPASSGGFSWGYTDNDLFKYYIDNLNTNNPRVDVLLTIANHPPFLIDNQKAFEDKYMRLISKLHLSSEQLAEYISYKKNYSCVMYADDAIRKFMAAYSKKASYNNTIFIFTGDHRMPETPIATQIDRFHVPLIIYSPLFTKGLKFGRVSSQLDITPTLLSFLAKKYDIKVPNEVSWIGGLLDDGDGFKNNKSIPFMRNKNQLVDYLINDYFICNEKLFKLYPNLDIEEINDVAAYDKVSSKFDQYKANNKKACLNNTLIKASK